MGKAKWVKEERLSRTFALDRFRGCDQFARMGHDDDITARPGRTAPDEAARVSRAITWASVAVGLILMVGKLFVYLQSGSVALLASFADSALDLVASISTFAAVRYAAAPADDEHRFGHGKAESFASLFQALLVAVSATLVAREAFDRFMHPEAIHHGSWALIMMGVSLVLTIGLVWMQTRALKKAGSLAVSGDRAHYAADIMANVSVIIGIALATYGGMGWVDPVVGFLVALWLLHAAWEVGSEAFNQMLDRELPDEERAHIKEIVHGADGVLDMHELRTRAAGSFVHIQFHLDLPPQITLAEAHEIVVDVERRLLAEFPAADILIHPDPAGEAEPHGLKHFRPNGEQG